MSRPHGICLFIGAAAGGGLAMLGLLDLDVVAEHRPMLNGHVMLHNLVLGVFLALGILAVAGWVVMELRGWQKMTEQVFDAGRRTERRRRGWAADAEVITMDRLSSRRRARHRDQDRSLG